MRKQSSVKALVFGIVSLLIVASVLSVTATPQERNLTAPRSTLPASSLQNIPQENPFDYLKNCSTETQQQVHQALTAGLDMYLVFSTSGTGHTFHMLLKIPHLRNSKGIFFAAMIVNTGLTAMTTVWRMNNATNGTLVDAQIGPHVVVFLGIGYSTYNRNLRGGSGSMLAVSSLQPFLLP
jgi:hypothetical protein